MRGTGRRVKPPYYEVSEGAVGFWPAGEATEGLRIPADGAEDGPRACDTTDLVSYMPEGEAAPKEEHEVTYCFDRTDLKLVEEQE